MPLLELILSLPTGLFISGADITQPPDRQSIALAFGRGVSRRNPTPGPPRCAAGMRMRVSADGALGWIPEVGKAFKVGGVTLDFVDAFDHIP